jgi:iron-sulfur cluster repair protein YtfE (RIC family)
VHNHDIDPSASGVTVTVDNHTDMTEMFAVHDCLRHEFARLPLTVKAVAEGNADRAAVVGGHVMMMTSMLHAHHDGEDALVWPLLEERSPEHADLVASMVEQHETMLESVTTAQAQAQAWMASPGILERSSLHTTLIKLEKELLHHLAVEEQEVVPLISRDLTHEEYAAVGAHSRAALTPEQLAVGLGLILSNTSAERGDAILNGMPAEARAGFEQFGRPVYAAYAERLSDY